MKVVKTLGYVLFGSNHEISKNSWVTETPYLSQLQEKTFPQLQSVIISITFISIYKLSLNLSISSG